MNPAHPASTPKDLNRRTEHVACLDGLRGLAILLVLFLHFTIIVPQSPFEEWLVNLASLGTHGVDLFFVLSGYLVTGILLKAKGRVNFFKNFYARRALRIFPLYYLLVLASFVVLPVLLEVFPKLKINFSTLDSNPKEWPWYCFFASNFLTVIEKRFTHDLLGVSWSLAIEEHFYLIWPWFVAAFDVKALKRILSAVIVFALLLRMVLWVDGWTPIQIYVLTFTRMDTIAFGAMLALQMHSMKPVGLSDPMRRRAALFLAGGGLLGVLAFMEGWFNVKSVYLNTLMYSAIGLFFYQMLKWVILSAGSPVVRHLFENGVIRAIGRYSYALYLFHIPVRVLVRNLWLGESQFRSLPGFALFWQGVFYAMAFGVTFILAVLSWNLIEKRFLNLKKHFEF